MRTIMIAGIFLALAGCCGDQGYSQPSRPLISTSLHHDQPELTNCLSF